MRTAHVIIHENTMRNFSASSELAEQARGPLAEIERVKETEQVVEWTGKRSNVAVAEQFKPGDTVTLYGCFTGVCLREAFDALSSKGVKVDYSSEGCL